jgi:hypothetical protein
MIPSIGDGTRGDEQPQLAPSSSRSRRGRVDRRRRPQRRSAGSGSGKPFGSFWYVGMHPLTGAESDVAGFRPCPDSAGFMDAASKAPSEGRWPLAAGGAVPRRKQPLSARRC